MIEALDDKDGLIARYLLNELSESENEDLEDEMVLDDELAERRQTVEMNLIDSYVMDEMSPDERHRFESGFLLFPENRLKVEEARMLHESLSLLRKEQAGEQPEPSEAQDKPSRSRPETAAVSGRRWLGRFPVPAFAVAALLLALVLSYFFIPWRKLFRGRADNQNIVVNPSHQATPGVITQPGSTPNSNGPENLGGNQNTLEQPEVALLPRAPEVVSGTIVERPGLVGGSQTRGPKARAAIPQSAVVTRGSKLFRLTVILLPDRLVEKNTRLSVKVYNVNNLDDPIFPGKGILLLTPGRVSKGKPRYAVTMEIPTSLLRDGQTYYVRLNEETEPTAFKVKRVDPAR
jgi:hypothetical protein